MRDIEIFYHFFLPNDLRAGAWPMWVDEQIGAIRRSGLSDIARVKMIFTMPLFWLSAGNMLFNKNGVQDKQVCFHEAVEEYVTTRYNFVDVIAKRDVNETPLYEGLTLAHLYQSACEKTENTNILYFHTKGISRNNAQTHNWREMLQHFCITRWTDCVQELESHDAVGVTDGSSNNIFSGNFWWATSDYIKTLKPPLESHLYMENPLMHPYKQDYRYAFELWILSNPEAKHKFLFHSKTNHYGDFFFVENL